MIFCPGGGLRVSAFEKEGTLLAKKLVENGILAAVLKYRLSPLKINKSRDNSKTLSNTSNKILKETLNYATDDALDAIEYLRTHADMYGIDPNQIGVNGLFSWGHIEFVCKLS